MCFHLLKILSFYLSQSLNDEYSLFHIFKPIEIFLWIEIHIFDSVVEFLSGREVGKRKIKIGGKRELMAFPITAVFLTNKKDWKYMYQF